MPANPGITKPSLYTFRYKFSEDGGAIGAITLTDSGHSNPTGELPDNALILAGYLETIVAPTSGGSATIMLGTADDTDALVAATAFDNALFTAGTVKELTAAIPQKVDQADDLGIVVTVATAALTAGEFDIHLLVARGR